jgi:hypothetical protein
MIALYSISSGATEWLPASRTVPSSRQPLDGDSVGGYILLSVDILAGIFTCALTGRETEAKLERRRISMQSIVSLVRPHIDPRVDELPGRKATITAPMSSMSIALEDPLF